MNNDFRDSESNENIKAKESENGHCKNADNSTQGQTEAWQNSSEIKESLEKEGSADALEGREDCLQGQSLKEEVPTDESEEADDNKEDKPNIESTVKSSSYTYTPTGNSQSRDNANAGNEKTRRCKKKHSLGIGIIAVILAIALFVTALGGALGMFAVNGMMWVADIAHDMFTVEIQSGGQQSGQGSNQGSGQDSGDFPAMNIVKSDKGIDLNVQTGSTGYPEDMSIPQVVELVADSVVEIITTNVVTDMFYNQYVKSGAGSGVIITADGYIVTNYHVIDGARSAVVRLNNGSEFSASYVGGDPEKDVAVIKIAATGLSAAVMGSSKDLVVGQDVIAIGNPLGTLGGTVTDGIISALDRTVVVDGHQMTLMQTNAAINPGNSGGGLFNRAGELIGIVNAKQSDTGIEGLGFAIPIDVVFECIQEIAKGS